MSVPGAGASAPGVASLMTATPVAGGLLSQMQKRGTLPSTGASPSPMKAAERRGSGDPSPAPHRSCVPRLTVQTPPRMKSFDALGGSLGGAADMSGAGQLTAPWDRRSTDKQPEAISISASGRPPSSGSALAPPVGGAISICGGDLRSSSGKVKATSAGRKGSKAAKSDLGTMGPPVMAAKGQKRTRKAPASKAPISAPAPAPGTPERRRRPPRAALPTKLEEDNYEISDREEGSDEIVDAADRSSKFVPTWCQDVSDRLSAQADVDPDSVFGSCLHLPCDLDQIFPDSLYRSLRLVHAKRPRGSSCKWDKDRLTSHEVDAYTQKMGQRRRLSMFQRRSLLPSKAPAQRTGKPQRGGA